MNVVFKILDPKDIHLIIPLVFELNKGNIPETTLKIRFSEMVTQNYECAVTFADGELIGVCGLWFCTRHYSGKSVELDHVFLKEGFRGKEIGKQFINWIEAYIKSKGYETMELNAYVNNHKAHKFYMNDGYDILGYHFLKKLQK
ncbi:GNAT family N-acetyltransferase [Gaetbulibacter aestuarii]|uniref:GNAT family N-acetyltransferase n=1 Tax=Gaetbulibacter aestuarii TaxID=1502358 RepID=A0ABW7MYN6_9FLAO